MNRLFARLFGQHRSLAPSVTAIGPNVYLSGNDFLKMLCVAFLVHVLAFGVAALWPNDDVNHIPVRALSFKLGGSEKPVAPAAPRPTAVAAPVMQATTAQTWQATPNVPAPTTPAPLQPVAPAKQPAAAPEKPAATAANSSTPKQYVREVGAAPVPTPPAAPAGAAVTNVDAQLVQAVRARYEQEISSWIQRHKFYPAEAGGHEGRVVVRMRIDRMGNVRYYAIEQSSGLTALDAAALDMIRRANPVPAVPENYPAGTLLEFLIPISFKAPQ